MLEVNWFPGHMAKTRRLIQNNLRQVDLLLEICDARIPLSSRNPELRKLVGNKPSILLLGKADLADAQATEQSLSFLNHGNCRALAVDLISGTGMRDLHALLKEESRQIRERFTERGRANRPLRAMVVGIPNSGKSTLINKLAGRSAARRENRPGVTRAIQWIKCSDGLELMDMPGILWPNLGTDRCKLSLAATGSIRDEILNLDEIAFYLFGVLEQKYPHLLEERYDLDLSLHTEDSLSDTDEISQDSYLTPLSAAPVPKTSDPEIALVLERRDIIRRHMEQAALNKNLIRKGGIADGERFARQFLSDFRKAKLGRISLEIAAPPDV